MINEVKLCDNMDYMETVPDGYFELAIVDPPYGIGEDGDKIKKYNSKSCKSWKSRKPKEYTKKNWDNEPPTKEYFNELFRVSKKQIIWGCNYFTDKLPVSGGRIVWDKQVVMPTFSDGEIAWTNLSNSLSIARFLWAGYRKCEETNRIHPTQKPVALYKWLLKKYAKPGYKIFDSHVGSGSSRIACYDMGFDFIGCELDKDYWTAQEERYKNYTAQTDLFSGEELQKNIFETGE